MRIIILSKKKTIKLGKIGKGRKNKNESTAQRFELWPPKRLA